MLSALFLSVACNQNPADNVSDAGPLPDGALGADGGFDASWGQSDSGPSYDAASGYDAAIGSDAGPGADAGPDGGDDLFEEVGTNPFVHTDHDPFSTFAADVDTASYDIFIRDIEDGLLPDTASVRLEEYVNYFNYDYPAPDEGGEVPFQINLAAGVHPMGRELAHLRVGIQARLAPEFVKRPTNLVFLIDVSGSMSAEDKLPLVQHLMRETVGQLDESDTISIVTYAGATRVALSPTPATEAEQIIRAINSLGAGGGTAGGAGIELAYDQARAGFIEDGINHIVLCTDGDFNIGVSSNDALVDLIREERLSGVTLTAVGFGRGNLNDAMMERVSNAGNGIYSVLSSREQTTTYAQDRLLNTVFQVAQDMKIQVEFNPDHVQAYRLLGYENRAIADSDFREDRVDAGEVGAGHRVTALYELVLIGQSVPSAEGAPLALMGEPVEGLRDINTEELVRVRVRYKEVGASPEDPAFEVSESLAPEAATTAIDELDDDVLWAAAIAAFAEILKDSPFADRLDLDRIESIVMAQALVDAERALFVEHFLTARILLGE